MSAEITAAFPDGYVFQVEGVDEDGDKFEIALTHTDWRDLPDVRLALERIDVALCAAADVEESP